MRLRNVKGSKEFIASNPYVIQEPEKNKGNWHNIFKNNNPIHIEIGMGKGKFIHELAIQNPNINYIGIEKFSSVLYRALEKREIHNTLNNLFFVRMDAENITDVFAAGEVSLIYLNFSDPWPKDRHAKRRLTSVPFMNRYQEILSKNGSVFFKTDNRPLFEFSIESIKEAGWSLSNVTYDLHHSDTCKNNVMTEYEERFSSQGNPILRLEAHR